MQLSIGYFSTQKHLIPVPKDRWRKIVATIGKSLPVDYCWLARALAAFGHGIKIQSTDEIQLVQLMKEVIIVWCVLYRIHVIKLYVLRDVHYQCLCFPSFF